MRPRLSVHLTWRSALEAYSRPWRHGSSWSQPESNQRRYWSRCRCWLREWRRRKLQRCLWKPEEWSEEAKYLLNVKDEGRHLRQLRRWVAEASLRGWENYEALQLIVAWQRVHFWTNLYSACKCLELKLLQTHLRHWQMHEVAAQDFERRE